MEKNLALVLLLTPFIGFLFNVFFGKKSGKTVSGIVGTLSVVVSFVATIYFFIQIQANPKPIQVDLFQWISLETFNVNFSFL